MKLSHSHKKHNKIDFYKFGEHADVFLHRNIQKIETKEEVQYIAEEIYLRLGKNTKKEEVESNFDYYWSLGLQKELQQEDYLLDLEFRISTLELGL